ncbi:MAG: hypothetical protein JSU94_01055 [Phycisphaerales bacterium]|nr:MAG: hypothetical protein JSU94_01055 [Phycisphaerales bacterium]
MRRDKVTIVLLSLTVISGIVLVVAHHRWSQEVEVPAYFKADARRLMVKLRAAFEGHTPLPPGSNKERMIKAMKILQNDQFDEDVVVYQIGFSIEDKEPGGFLLMNYVDEKANLAEIRYKLSPSDPNDPGGVLVAPEVLGPREMRHVGRFPFCLYLRPNDELPEGSIPYLEVDAKNDSDYLLVPESFFKNLADKKGELILLDEAGNVLDRFDLVDFVQSPTE